LRGKVFKTVAKTANSFKAVFKSVGSDSLCYTILAPESKADLGFCSSACPNTLAGGCTPAPAGIQTLSPQMEPNSPQQDWLKLARLVDTRGANTKNNYQTSQ